MFSCSFTSSSLISSCFVFSCSLHIIYIILIVSGLFSFSIFFFFYYFFFFFHNHLLLLHVHHILRLLFFFFFLYFFFLCLTLDSFIIFLSQPFLFSFFISCSSAFSFIINIIFIFFSLDRCSKEHSFYMLLVL